MLSRERIAKLPRYCRNYAHETQKCPAKDGGARITCAMDGAYKLYFSTGSLSVHLSPTHCRAPLQDPHMYTHSQTF